MKILQEFRPVGNRGGHEKATARLIDAVGQSARVGSRAKRERKSL